tara:strand:+ start:9687 stop:9920 length:234 start_codon:yes stop_codon:yes gene_type:complete
VGLRIIDHRLKGADAGEQRGAGGELWCRFGRAQRLVVKPDARTIVFGGMAEWFREAEAGGLTILSRAGVQGNRDRAA